MKVSRDDGHMASVGTRVRRTLAEKRRIVELTFLPGRSVARVAQAEGINSHQVFQWRRAYRSGGLGAPELRSTALLPVVVSAESASAADVDIAREVTKPAVAEQAPAATGAIHIELPGRATISVESGADRALLRTVLESLRK